MCCEGGGQAVQNNHVSWIDGSPEIILNILRSSVLSLEMTSLSLCADQASSVDKVSMAKKLCYA